MRNYSTGIYNNPVIDAWNQFDPLLYAGDFTGDLDEDDFEGVKKDIVAVANEHQGVLRGRITLTLLAKLDEVLDLPGEPLGGIPDSWTYAFAGTRAEVVEAMIGEATVDDRGDYTWASPTLLLSEIPGKKRRKRFLRRLRGVLRRTGRYPIHRVRAMKVPQLIRSIRKHRERFGL